MLEHARVCVGGGVRFGRLSSIDSEGLESGGIQVSSPDARGATDGTNWRGRDIVVLGGSAGGLQAVTAILTSLPVDLAAALFVVLHRDPHPAHPDLLSTIFGSQTAFRAQATRDEQPIETGHLYVAPADHHMLLGNGLIRLQPSPPEHGFRPCIDVLFGQRVIGVLVSGRMGTDGAAGLSQITERGGVTIVQDPRDAAFPGMPQAAIDNVAVDFVLPLSQIAPKLMELVSRQRVEAAAASSRILIVEDDSVVATDIQIDPDGRSA